MNISRGNPRDFEALEKRRFEALRLIKEGVRPSEVARRVNVVRQTVSRWASQYAQGGAPALEGARRAGRKPRLNEHQRRRLRELLLRGPKSLGYGTALWTCPQVADLIKKKFNITYHPGHAWKILTDLLKNPQKTSPTRLKPSSRSIGRRRQA